MIDKTAFGHATHTGRVRDHNEDAYSALPELGLWIIADGMGGHEGGEVASSIVVDHVTAKIRQGIALSEALGSAHKAVMEAAESGMGKLGMGSTAVALKLDGNRYKIAWVGDSRAYLWNGRQLNQLTRDHSFVQQLLDQGAIDEEEAEIHPYRNVISQSLGSTDSANVRVETVRGELFRGERILLCSDGLSGEVRDQDIAETLKQVPNVQEAVDQLIARALENGGGDNVTVILVGAPDNAPLKPNPAKTQPIETAAIERFLRAGNSKRWFFYGSLVAFLLAVIGMVVLGIINLSADNKTADVIHSSALQLVEQLPDRNQDTEKYNKLSAMPTRFVGEIENPGEEGQPAAIKLPSPKNENVADAFKGVDIGENLSQLPSLISQTERLEQGK